MVSGELLFNCKSLTRCVGVNYADISRGYFSSVLFSPGKKHFIRGCRNQNTTLHSLTLSHMCFHKRKHFSLATSPLVPKDFRGARWARKIICSLLFWWGLEIRPLNPSLTHTDPSHCQLKGALGVSLRCHLVLLGTTEVIQAQLSQGKPHLQTGSDSMVPPLCSSSAIPQGKVTLGLGSEAGFDPGYLCSDLVNKTTVMHYTEIQHCALNLDFQRQQ